VAVFWMQDEKGPDAKVLCVPATDPRYAGTTDLDTLPEFLLSEIGHFFDVYKALEPDKGTETRGWEGREAAEAAVDDARRRYRPH
jgi:inorganic pyrophosphatase